MKEEEEGEEFQTYKQLEKLWQPLLLNVLYHYTVLSSSETGWRAKDMYYDKAEKKRTNKNVLLWLRTECLFSPNPGLMSLSLQISSPWLFFQFSFFLSSTFYFLLLYVLHFISPPHCVSFILSFEILFELIPSLQSVKEGIWSSCYHTHQQYISWEDGVCYGVCVGVYLSWTKI